MEMQERTNIPTIIPLGKNFTPGKGIKICCTVTPEASRFTIILFCGYDITSPGDCALNVTFNLTGNNTSITSKRNDTWDKDIVKDGIPFDCDERLEVFILCEQFYKVYINGTLYCEYPPFVTYDKITFIAVKGDICIERIFFEPDSFQFGVVNMPYKVQYPIVQQMSYDPTIVPLNWPCPRVPQRQINWKVYSLYSCIMLLALVTVLCLILVPKYGSKYEYDFD